MRLGKNVEIRSLASVANPAPQRRGRIMYAIVEIAGKQYKVQKDDLLYIPRIKENEKKKLTFDRVLLVSNGKNIKVGTPTVAVATVKATVLGHVKADKVLVFKKKRRKRYRVKRGHRQPYTQIQVNSVTVKSASKTKSSTKEEKLKTADTAEQAVE